MNDLEKQKLLSHSGEFISIGITEDGNPRGSIAVPWERTAHAFNMKLPNVYFSRQDFESGELFSLISKFKVFGCYIFAAISDYSFLSDFKEIRDVFIADGRYLTDLSFMADLDDCGLLYIRGAHISDLAPLTRAPGESSFMYLRCLSFDSCIIDDISALIGWDHFFSELIIREADGIHERSRWEGITRTSVFRYFESSSHSSRQRQLSSEDEKTLLEYIEKKMNPKR